MRNVLCIAFNQPGEVLLRHEPANVDEVAFQIWRAKRGEGLPSLGADAVQPDSVIARQYRALPEAEKAGVGDVTRASADYRRMKGRKQQSFEVFVTGRASFVVEFGIGHHYDPNAQQPQNPRGNYHIRLVIADAKAYHPATPKHAQHGEQPLTSRDQFEISIREQRAPYAAFRHPRRFPCVDL